MRSEEGRSDERERKKKREGGGRRKDWLGGGDIMHSLNDKLGLYLCFPYLH